MGCIKNYYDSSGDYAYLWAAKTIAQGNYSRLLDVGCSGGSPWLLEQLKKKPDVFCGVESHEESAKKAREQGIDVKSFDLNSKWLYDDCSFDAVHSSQVIEHVHNTRSFLSEAFRVLKPGGVLVVTSENLTSFLNLCAMILGYTPFSLVKACGWYIGNPCGIHDKESFEDTDGPLPPLDADSFSGITGHNRVLSVYQANEFMHKIGFVDVEVKSVGLMPLPRWIGKPLEKLMWRRGHWLMIKASKPA